MLVSRQVSDIRGKKVAVATLNSLLGCQLQWLELLKSGVDLMSDPAQVN